MAKHELSSSEMAEQELWQAGIDPDSAVGHDFTRRATAFGIMGVQPPTKPDEPRKNGLFKTIKTVLETVDIAEVIAASAGAGTGVSSGMKPEKSDWELSREQQAKWANKGLSGNGATSKSC